MVELEVEAVGDIDAPIGVEAPSCVLYGGKGGVGKTTMAAATALASSRDGTPTLVVSTDPAHSLADTFERAIPDEPTKIHDEYPLFAVEIDPETAMESEGGLAALGGLDPDNHPLAELFSGGVMPGADEAVALQQLMLHLDDDRFDRVVIDTAPTGHTLRLLELPEMLDSLLGRLLTLRERFSGMIGGLFGDETEELADTPGLDDLREQIERVRTVLQDPTQTDFRLVVVPEMMSVTESKRLLAELEEARIPVETIVVNRVMEDPAAVSDSIEPGTIPAPDHEHCAFCKRRWEVQREALSAAQELFQGRTVKRVPLFAGEIKGERMLRLVASCLD